MEHKQLLTVEQMARVLNVRKSWIYQRTMLGRNAIPHIKVGRLLRFDLEEVLMFFKSSESKVS